MSGLPKGWAECELQQIVETLDSRRVPLNSDERAARTAGKPASALFPYYGATGQVGYIDDYIFDEPLILLGEDGVPFFDLYKHKAYRVAGKTWVNNHAHVLKPIADACDDRFLKAYLNICDYTGHVTGTTRPKLTQGAMNKLPIPLAPLPEQKLIADKLDRTLARVDACRGRLDRLPALLKRCRQAILAAATSGRLTEDWRQGREYSATPTQFASLVAESVTGLVRSTTEQFAESSGRTPYLKMNNVNEHWGYDDSGLVYVECSEEEKQRFQLKPGDWLFNTRNSVELVGKSCVWNGDPIVFNNNLLRVRFKEEANPWFMEVWFRSPRGRDSLAAVKSATTSVAAIYQRSLMAITLDVPDIEEQREIVRRVEALFAFIDRLEARLVGARKQVGQLTPALLAKAFRGELVPQAPDDEPASALLERLAAARGAAPKTRRGRKATAL